MVPRFALLLVAAATTGCYHSRPATNPYVHGRPPEYSLPAALTAPNVLADFVEQVRQRQAEAAVGRRAAPPVATVETSDPELKVALAVLRERTTPASYRRVAGSYLRLGVRDAALDGYTAAIALDRRDGASYEMRARVWRDSGFPGLGLGDGYRAVFYDPDSATARNTLGTLFHRMARYEDAASQYERALALDPTAAYALNNLCALAIERGRPDEAQAACRQALAIDGELQAAQRNLAVAEVLAAADEREARDARH